jgi:integrative and conjugative element protein (TIGR02256 family)
LIVYPVGTSGQTVLLIDTVVQHLYKHRQYNLRRVAGGGQLFAAFQEQTITVVCATGPRRSDRRLRTSYLPNRQAERREINRLFRKGLHYIGDWHTHPESCPVPSRIDLDNFAETVRLSRYHLGGFVMIVVGTSAPPEGFHVSLCNGHDFLTLHSS